MQFTMGKKKFAIEIKNLFYKEKNGDSETVFIQLHDKNNNFN